MRKRRYLYPPAGYRFDDCECIPLNNKKRLREILFKVSDNEEWHETVRQMKQKEVIDTLTVNGFKVHLS